jgi:hypothetical protein
MGGGDLIARLTQGDRGFAVNGETELGFPHFPVMRRLLDSPEDVL